jgi:hypothetical protein
MLAWGLRNVSIIHDKHIDVECTMHDYVELRSCLGFPLHMACVESMVFMFHGENQGCRSERGILDCFHTVMFMSINPNETIESFKARGREMVVESFDNLQPCVV